MRTAMATALTAPTTPTTRIATLMMLGVGVLILTLLLGLLTRARDVLRVFINVEVLLDGWRDWLDLGSQLLFNTVQVEAVIPIDQVDSQTQVTETSRAADSMKICLGVLREIEIDDNVDSLDINTPSQQVGTNQVAADALTEVVKDAVTVMLEHARVRIETRIAKFSDLLSKQLNTIGRIAEDDRLVDLQLVEESVQTVNLLLLFNEGVILGDATEGKFVHQVNLVGAVHVFILEALNLNRESCTEEHNLAVLGVEIQELFNNWGEFGRQEFVSLIHDKGLALGQISNTLACQIQNSSRRSNNDMDRFIQPHDVVFKVGTSSRYHYVHAKVLAKLFADL